MEFKVGDKVRLTGKHWSLLGADLEDTEQVIEDFSVSPGFPGLGVVPVFRPKSGFPVYYIYSDGVEDYSATLVEPAKDAVSPGHYKFGKSEVIDITRHLSFPLGNVVKYVTRAGRKGAAKEDLLKARKYLDWAIEDCDD